MRRGGCQEPVDWVIRFARLRFSTASIMARSLVTRDPRHARIRQLLVQQDKYVVEATAAWLQVVRFQPFNICIHAFDEYIVSKT